MVCGKSRCLFRYRYDNQKPLVRVYGSSLQLPLGIYEYSLVRSETDHLTLVMASMSSPEKLPAKPLLFLFLGFQAFLSMLIGRKLSEVTITLGHLLLLDRFGDNLYHIFVV